MVSDFSKNLNAIIYKMNHLKLLRAYDSERPEPVIAVYLSIFPFFNVRLIDKEN